ncbi:adenylate/guanylate cyclase domain-containing protein [Edaphocola aurantiacus]|uniref:adenylate/guanylate cyclase domain-containing protein n=1 Tax=Edaphocola aurantiacus TaxID=2601682 RepID=UPI001C9698F1|nr:adenylate/guanylate cyclase domain-containing protein [Edaphocola aurantiacus]
MIRTWAILTGLCFLLLNGVCAKAQTTQTGKKDSLLAALPKARNEADRANIHFEMGRDALSGKRYREALTYLNASLPYYHQSKDLKKEGRIYFGIGVIYINGLRQTDSGIIALNKAEALAKQLQSDSLLNVIYSLLIYTHSNMGNTKESLTNSRNRLAIGLRTQNDNVIAESYHYIGIAYATMGENRNAMDNYRNSLAYYRKSGNKTGISDLMLNMGEQYFREEKYDTARTFLNDALKIAEEQGNKGKQTVILSMLTNLYITLKDTTNLNIALDKGMAAAQATADPMYISSFSVIKGLVDLYGMMKPDGAGSFIIIPGRRQEFEQTVATVTQQLDIYKQSSIDISRWTQIHLALAIANNLLGRPQMAYDNLIEYNRYKDSFANQEKAKQFSEMERRVVADAADVKVNYANTVRNVSLAGLVLLLLASGVILYAYRQKRRDNKLIAAERAKSDNLLLNILPLEVAEELKAKGSSKAQQFDEVSVLFTDFVNFTKISESLGVDELLEELNIHFTAFDRIMEQHGLEKIKTIGDAYLAVSGLPVANEMHAVNAIAAAKDIIAFVAARRHQVPYGLDIRIGIHSGPLIAGIIGVKKFAYDIWGDTVNTAARMEQNSTPGRINISENTCSLVKENYTCTYRGKIDVKGKGALDMYFVE